MNESRFDAAVKAVASAPQERSTLNAKVSESLLRRTRMKRLRSRMLMAATGSCAVGVAMFVFPAVKAQASLRGILTAMDGAGSACVTAYIVDDAGHELPCSKTVIADGKQWYRDASGKREVFTIGDKQYAFDPTTQAYVVHESRHSTGLRLSELLGPAGGFSLDKRVEMTNFSENGRSYVKAVIENGRLPERYTLVADAKTDLPVSGYVEGREAGVWRKGQIFHFEYGATAKIVGPDFKRYKVITPREQEARFAAAMDRQMLAEKKFANGRLVIRAIEAAQDGTIFVAFQAGDHSARSWNGYGISIQDSLGTPYVRVGQFGNMMEGPFDDPDGKVEEEVFTPPTPQPITQPRTVSVFTQHDSKGRFTRMIQVGVVEPGGKLTMHWQGNLGGNLNEPPVQDKLLSKTFSGATCGTHPSWAETVDFSRYSSDPSTEISIWEARAADALTKGQWQAAEDGFNHELAAMNDFQQQGYGSWSRDRPLRGIEKARKHDATPLN